MSLLLLVSLFQELSEMSLRLSSVPSLVGRLNREPASEILKRHELTAVEELLDVLGDLILLFLRVIGGMVWVGLGSDAMVHVMATRLCHA